MPSVHPTILEIDPDEWNCLAGDNVFATHGWLRTVETCFKADIRPRYFTLHRGSALIAAAVCYVFPRTDEVETLDDILFGRLRSAARALGFSFLPSFVCGPIFGYGWHIEVDKGLSTRDQSVARDRVLSAIESEAHSQRLRTSFVRVLDAERELKELLRKRGYLRCRDAPISVLDLRWNSFEDYLCHLPRRKRKEFRRQINRNRKAGVVIGLVDYPGPVERRLHELVELNSLKHNARPFGFREGFFSELKANLGKQARIFQAQREGATTGVSVVLTQKQTAFTTLVGVDHATAGDDYTYFRVCYYSPIADAIEKRIRRIYFGRGMYKVKTRRGCRLTNAWTYYGGAGPMRYAVTPWLALLSFWNRCKLPQHAEKMLQTD